MPAYECMVIIEPLAVAGAASPSAGPRWSGHRLRNSPSRPRVSGSLSAALPGYVWLHSWGLVPLVFQWSPELRLRSTPTWLNALGGLAQLPPFAFRFLRCRYGELPPCCTRSTPSGLAIGTTHTSVLLSSAVTSLLEPYPVVR